ncbi:MAG: type II toxin-antitoxin system HicA family toxin, partial [Gammaproteobacteria bacterium]
VKTFEQLGFHVVREREHISMARDNPDGTQTPLTLPKDRRSNAGSQLGYCFVGRVGR